MDNKTLILEKFLRLALGPIKNVHKVGQNFQFKCNVCGDAPTKSRGYLLKSKSRKNHGKFWAFKCFNDGCQASGEGNAWSAENWLKFTNKNLHKQFVREYLTSENPIHDEKKLNEQIEIHEKQIRAEELVQKKEKASKEKTDLKHFIKITKNHWLCNKAKKYCVERKIPKEIWSKWFVSTDGTYKNRMIIPFYGNDGKIIYFQGRTLSNQIPKYLNRTTNKDKAIYNIENIDEGKPVIVLEGPVDSMFIENGVAVLGTEISEERQKVLASHDVYYLFDNDKAGRRKSEQFLMQGKRVFLWNKFEFKKYKDINEIIMDTDIEKFSFEDLKDKFTSDYYDVLHLRDTV